MVVRSRTFVNRDETNAGELEIQEWKRVKMPSTTKSEYLSSLQAEIPEQIGTGGVRGGENMDDARTVLVYHNLNFCCGCEFKMSNLEEYKELSASGECEGGEEVEGGVEGAVRVQHGQHPVPAQHLT